MVLSGARWTAIGLLCVAVATLWQAQTLPRWGLDGPGTGLFPQILAVVAIALSALVLLLERPEPPVLDNGDGEAVSRYDLADPAQRRVFHFYLLALVLMVAGTWWLGFIVTVTAVIITIMRFGEGVGWRATLITAASVVTVGQFGFGWLLQVSLPAGPVDRAVLALMRAAGML